MVKEKSNSIRIYDKDGFRLRAAAICIRSEAETEVSLVKTISNYLIGLNFNLVIPLSGYVQYFIELLCFL